MVEGYIFQVSIKGLIYFVNKGAMGYVHKRYFIELLPLFALSYLAIRDIIIYKDKEPI